MLHRFSGEKKPTGKSLFEIWCSMPKKEKGVFLGNLTRNKRWREDLEDLMDIAICEERSKEPTRPLEDVLRERRRRYHRKKN